MAKLIDFLYKREKKKNRVRTIRLFNCINFSYTKRRMTNDSNELKPAKYASKFKTLENIHKGKRCFIVGTGPSILEQDLTLLKDEYVIAMSNLLQHKDYKTINPEYYIHSGINHHKSYGFDLNFFMNAYQQIEARLTPKSKLLLNYTDQEDIEENNFLVDRDIYYGEFTQNINDLATNGLVATMPLYEAQSISIMALQYAILMGFSEIYLVGCDHNWIFHGGQNNHFYKEHESFYRATEETATQCDNVNNMTEWGSTFTSLHHLWLQYEFIKEYVEENRPDIKIYYATKNGLLDVFEKVEYESLFSNELSNKGE